MIDPVPNGKVHALPDTRTPEQIAADALLDEMYPDQMTLLERLRMDAISVVETYIEEYVALMRTYPSECPACEMARRRRAARERELRKRRRG